MAALSAFSSTYLAPGVLPLGTREQLAGAVKAVEVQFLQGAVGAQALTNVNTKRLRRIVYKAQREVPTQTTLIADFYAIDSA